MSYLKASALGVVSRVVAAGCRLLSLPLVLVLLDPARYGLWLMLTSVMAWLSLTDLGIPSAVQNPLVAKFSAGDPLGAARLLRHAYGLLTRIALLVGVLGVVFSVALPLQGMLNVAPSHVSEFRAALIVGIVLVCLSLPLRLTGILAYATDRAYLPPCVDIVTQFVSFSLIVFFAFIKFSSLFSLVIAISLVQLLVSGAFSLWLLRRSGLTEKMRAQGTIPPAERAQLTTKGMVFLLVLIGEGLVLQSDALLLGHFKGAAAVTAYLVPHTLFLQFLFVQNAFLRPIWATFTRHSALGERAELRRLLMRGLWFSLLGAAIFGVGFGVLGDWFVRFWSRDVVRLPPVMGWGFAAYAIVASVSNLLALFCNAVGLVGQRLYGIVLFGLVKVSAGAIWLHYRGLDELPFVYALVCLCTDVLILTWVTKRFLNSGTEVRQ